MTLMSMATSVLIELRSVVFQQTGIRLIPCEEGVQLAPPHLAIRREPGLDQQDLNRLIDQRFEDLHDEAPPLRRQCAWRWEQSSQAQRLPHSTPE
jgi:hypothetical protein